MLNIDVSRLYKVFQDFYTLTNMKVVLFNKEQEVLMEYPSSKNTFCNLIADSEYWSKKCGDCDRSNVEICTRTEKTSKYSCHLGLAEAIVPIYDDNGMLGYLMVGQVLLEDNSEEIKKLMKEQFDEKEFIGIIDAIDKIPVKSSAELEACVTVLQAFTTYILSNQWVTPKRSEFIRHMDKFIENNLTKNITVDDICAEFHIKRTRLYGVAKEYLGCSIASYVRQQRIYYACRMLRETDEPISRIAEKVGFLDYGHFSRIFRQIQGVTATSYRKSYQTMHPLYNTLAYAGCAGIVFAAFETTEHEPEVPSWINGHGQFGWYHLKEEPLVPVFCVTPKSGIRLLELLSKGKVVLHGEMNTKVYDGEIYTVTATIPGKSDDEFAVLGHLYEPFKTDDCQGFAVGVEVAIMLKKLIDDGILPKPEKTLRLIFSMERYGYAAFFANNDKRILAATSIDSMTCQASKILNIGFSIFEAPLSCPFFGDMLFNEAMNSFCSDVKWRFRPGTLSDDCWMGEKTVDIPTNWCVSSSKDGRSDYHHCDAPIFDEVQPEILEKLVPMLATYLAVMICGDREHFAKMAVELEKTAAYWLEIKKNYAVGRTASGKMDKRDALWYNKAAELLYLGRMESFNRFYSGVVTPILPKHWADEFYNILSERELTPAEKKADSIRYRIKSAGVPFSQARVPASERVAWSMASELMWALLSPERSVLDAIRLHDAALSCNTSDEMIEYHLSYFSFLAKYGYLEEVK